jgi:hypothetical protein
VRHWRPYLWGRPFVVRSSSAPTTAACDFFWIKGSPLFPSTSGPASCWGMISWWNTSRGLLMWWRMLSRVATKKRGSWARYWSAVLFVQQHPRGDQW